MTSSRLVWLALAGLPLAAQWLEVKTHNVPVTRNGKPNLTAPAPKRANGKTPDFSAVWTAEMAPCEGSSLSVFGCNDAPFGVPIGVVDVTASNAAELERGGKEKLPYQPWAEA